MTKHPAIKFTALTVLLVVSVFLSLLYGGSETIGLRGTGAADFILWQIRFPKTITAIIAGCALAVSGLILQVIFRNPLAGPFVLGISSGAALMVAVCVLLGQAIHSLSGILLGKATIVLAAISGSFLITLLILAISRRVNSNVVLLLIGLMFSQICGAIQTALEYFADPNSLKTFVIWGMGSLANTTVADLALFMPVALVCLGALVFFVKPLNAMLLGQHYAQNVGVHFTRNRFRLIFISSVLTGITTAFCGPIAFIGTAVPILSRMLFKTSRQDVHLLSCLLCGSIILLLSDALCHSVLVNVALPINMMTTLIGAPLVIYLMFKNKHW